MENFIIDTNVWIRASCKQSSDGCILSELDKNNGGVSTPNDCSPRQAQAVLLDLVKNNAAFVVPAVRAELLAMVDKSKKEPTKFSDSNRLNLEAFYKQSSKISRRDGTNIYRIGENAITREMIIDTINARKTLLALQDNTSALKGLHVKLRQPPCELWFNNLLRRFDYALQTGQSKDIVYWPDYVIALDAKKLGLTLLTLDFEAYAVATMVLGTKAKLL